MKKIMLLAITLLFVSGCNAEYNLKIEGNVLSEELIINANDQYSSEEIMNNTEEYVSSIKDSNNYYKKDIKQNGDFYTMTLASTFERGTIRNSNIVNSCFDNFIVTNTSTMLRFLTSHYNTCFDKYPMLENLTINISTVNEVTRHNADSVIEGVYTWNITKKNYNEKTIQLVMGNNLAPLDNNSSTKLEKKDNTVLYIAICATLLIAGGLGFVVFQKKKKKQPVNIGE